MATEIHIRVVEVVIGYKFEKTSYLVEALTAAGVDENNYDGNRKLHLRQGLHEVILTRMTSISANMVRNGLIVFRHLEQPRGKGHASNILST